MPMTSGKSFNRNKQGTLDLGGLVVEETAFPEAKKLATSGHVQGSQANNSV